MPPRPKPHADILTVEFVGRLVAEQFPAWADLAVTPVEWDGWDNTSFRLGDEMVVRLPSGPSYAPQVDKEQEWLPRLAPLLPVPIPTPLARGAPAEQFPYAWSVYRWIEGNVVETAVVKDKVQFASDLAAFLLALYSIDAADGPPPGQHSAYRGVSVTYDDPTRPSKTPGNWAVAESLAKLEGVIDTRVASAVWGAALDAGAPERSVWVHGDVAPTNLLVRDGHLSAVIDWGCSSVGDPACDLFITWWYFEGESREAFTNALALDAAAWARGRGWALWKPLYWLAQTVEAPADPDDEAVMRRFVNDVLADHVANG